MWSVDLLEGLTVSPLSDGARVYLALRSAHLAARDIHDGSKELWRIERTVTSPLAAGDGLLFISAGNTVEALRGADGKTVWTVPRLTLTAPLVIGGPFVIAVTESDIVAIKAADGQIAWKRAAGGVSLAPAVDGDRVYVGADDGRLLALSLATGDVIWDNLFLEGGVTALAARAGIVYAGAGDKQFYFVKNGKALRPRRIGATVIGRIAVDDERVYFAARDNTIRGLDRSNGNQRWQETIRYRPFSGVMARGHVVFVPGTAAELRMFYDQNGHPSGTISLSGDMLQDLPPDIEETPDAIQVVVVTGGLSNQWRLTLYATTGEAALVPLGDFLPLAGVDLLTDPVLEPLTKVLGPIVFGDPPLVPLSMLDWPIRMVDPPLEPLTTLPGLQLRPLSPRLPPRRGASGPGG